MEEEIPPESPLKGIIWCRQVDNEAESPKYTPVPDDFEGLDDILPRTRFVGDLAINASDTADYWDPDPSKRLAFYGNLFLYPSRDGHSMCLGRMFLSTEDRPRLGIKTLVLDSSTLFAGGNAAATLKRWYDAMAGVVPGLTSSRSNVALMAELSQAFTYEKGDLKRPFIAMISDQWGSAVDSVFTLMERIPETLIALSGVLLFPYFIPAGKVDMAEFAKTFPLTLASFRIPGRLSTEQRLRRVEDWTKNGVNLIDLTTTPPKIPHHSSLTIQSWISDDERKQRMLKSSVDQTELKKSLTGKFPEDEGIFRRQEIARVRSLMETIAQKDKEPSKSSKKSAAPEPAGPLAPAAPALVPPDAVRFAPPWTESSRVTRIERVGVAPQAPIKPLPTPPSRMQMTRDEIERMIDRKVMEEITKFLAEGKGPLIERLGEVEVLRMEVRDMRERMKVFSDSTIPLLRRTWAKVEEMGNTPSPPSIREKKLTKLKAELWTELKAEIMVEMKRMEEDFIEHNRNILERMEGNLQTQGRIWLTLVQQMSRLTEERHTPEADRRARPR
jgi:hypothetical protein